MLGKRFHLFLNQNILQYTFEIVWPSVLQSFVKLKLYDSKQTCPICIHIHNSNAILNQPSHEAIWDSYLICVIFWSEITFPTMKPRTFEASFPENLRKIASPPGCLPGGRKNGTPDSGVMICRSFSIHVQVKPSLTPQAPGLRTLWDCKQCYQSARRLLSNKSATWWNGKGIARIARSQGRLEPKFTLLSLHLAKSDFRRRKLQSCWQFCMFLFPSPISRMPWHHDAAWLRASCREIFGNLLTPTAQRPYLAGKEFRRDLEGVPNHLMRCLLSVD